MITEKIDKVVSAKTWPGRIPVSNLYTAGVAGEKFLRAIQKEGKLIATVCPSCEKEFLPPKIFCPYCLKELQEWREIPPQGIVESFTVTSLNLYGNQLSTPRVFALIRFGKGGALIHRLGEIPPEKVKIGLKVEAVFKPASERRGSINDIDYFRPAKQLEF